MLFECEKAVIRPYFCPKCPLQTNILVLLRIHLRKWHTVNSKTGGIIGENEFFLKKHTCYNCSFETYSIFQLILHNKKCVCDLKTNPGKQLKRRKKNSHSIKKIVWFNCNYCDYKCKQKRYLKAHVDAVHPDKSTAKWLKCDNCEYTTKSRDSFTKHKLSAHLTVETGLFECDQCSYKTKWKCGLRRHILRHSNDVNINWFRCDQCIYKTKIESKLTSHKNKYHTTDNIQWFQCDYCEYKTKNKKYSVDHIKAVHPNESTAEWLQCDICDFTTKLRDLLTKHHKIKHAEKSFKCDKCEFKTKYDNNLRDHKIMVHKEHIPFEWFDCDQCNFETYSAKRLETHKRARHSTRKIGLIKCEYCDYKTKGKKRFIAHMNITHPDNSTAEWLQCFNCDFTIKSRNLLYKHTKNAHLNEKGFYECTKCSYKTKKPMTLRRHVLIHLSKINTNCTERDQFNSKIENESRLTCHKNNKDSTQTKLFGCDLCSYKGKNKHYLRQHMLTKHPSETTAPWLNCHYCDFTTKSRNSFNQHLKRRHRKSLECDKCPDETKNDGSLKEDEKLEIKDEKPFQ